MFPSSLPADADAGAAGVVFEGVAERLRGKTTRAISRQREKNKFYIRVTGEESSLFRTRGRSESVGATENRCGPVSEGLEGRALDFFCEKRPASSLARHKPFKLVSLFFPFSSAPSVSLLNDGAQAQSGSGRRRPFSRSCCCSRDVGRRQRLGAEEASQRRRRRRRRRCKRRQCSSGGGRQREASALAARV